MLKRQQNYFFILLLSFYSQFGLTQEDQKTKNIFSHLELFNKVMYLVNKQYYRNIDVEAMIYGAIKGMLDTLDPHSAFLPEDVLRKMKDETSGEFGGLGIEVTLKDGFLYVISPLDDTPAYKAGVKAGDKIVSINGISTLGLDLEDAVKKMKGAPGESITLGVSRKGKEKVLYFKITREVIKVKSVKSFLLDDHYLFIRLSQFQKDSTDSLIKAMKSYKDNYEIRGIILDLRSNPGGLLDEAIKISSVFLENGVVVSIEGRNKEVQETRYVLNNTYKETSLPLIVLVNGASASASEIVAGALQDHKRAIIMGARSFGKGTVQSVIQVDDKNAVKLTIAQYMTPLSRKIQVLGISPDIELDEVRSNWIEANRVQESYIRELDLKGHFEATIKSEDEKNLQKKILDERRADKRKKMTDDKKLPANEIFTKYHPKNDYQVWQAINYIKSIKVLGRGR